MAFTLNKMSILLVSCMIAVEAVGAMPQTTSPPSAAITCTTIASGLLSGTNGESTGWTFDGLDNLIYDTRTTGTVGVEFQACSPNPGGFANTPGGQISGHLYIPNFDQCLGVPDEVFLEIGKVACSDINDDSQYIQAWVYNNGKITWSGHTTADGSVIEGGDCGKDGIGQYGYEAVKKPLGVPNTGSQEVKCISTKTADRAFPFKLV